MHHTERSGRRAERVENVDRRPHQFGALDLRQQYRVDRQGSGDREIGMPPGRLDPVDPQDQLARRVAAGRQRRRDATTRRLLGLRGDGILEVENQSVNGKHPRLFERTRI
jgi:hypothetical protein